MADIVCYGACRGDPTYRQEGGALPCVLCSGSGRLPGPKSPEAVKVAYAAVAARARLSHPAIVAGDADPGPVRKPQRFRMPKRRVSKKQKRAAMRAERRWKEDQAFLNFRATRPPDWEKQLDELKAEYRKR